MDDWIDRFGRPALGMAAAQVGVLLLVLGMGLWPPSLGTHLVLPGLALLALFGAMVWLTLTRPWDATFSFEGGEHWTARRWHLWDPGLIGAVTLAVAYGFHGAFEDEKETVHSLVGRSFATAEDPVRYLLQKSEAEIWAADPWGADFVTGPNAIALVFLPAALVFILWLFLPRSPS